MPQDEERNIQVPVVSSSSEDYNQSTPYVRSPVRSSMPIQDHKVTSTIPFTDRNIIIAIERLLGE